MTAVTVVVDFGSAHTVVVACPPERLVVVEPSVVLLSQDDQLVAGAEALRLATADPSRLLSRLKSRVDEREVLVGDIVLPVPGLVRALLMRALRGVEEPIDELVLTHPVAWPSTRVAVLTRAAKGLAARVSTLASPLAAAAGADLEPGAVLLVVDFGATACEVAAVRRSADGGLEVAAHGALPLGGDDLDDRLGDGVDVRTRKEQVVLTGTTEGLTVAELERRIADDVAEIVDLVERVTADAAVDRVLLVGGSSRIPMVGRRIAEVVGRPMRLAEDPEHAVAWGALRQPPPTAAPVPPPPEQPAEPRPPLRPFRRRVVVAAALLVLAVAVAAVAVVGIGPGQLTAGLPGPVDAPAPPAVETDLPPEVTGREMVSAGQPAFASGRMGTPVRYRDGAGTTLELVLDGVQADRTAAAPFEEAPLGYRWVTVFMSGTNVSGPAWRQDLTREVAVLDDRGQWIRPLAGGAVACDPERPLPATVAQGGGFDACVLVPVPESTPVTSVVFGNLGVPTPPVRFPIAVPPSSPDPAPQRTVGRLGEPPIEVTVNGVAVRAGFHLVLTPSGYLGTRRPAPGNRYVIVRAQLPAMGTAEHVYLRDDRGALTNPLSGFDTMPDCPPFGGLGDPGRIVYACFVYELDADTPVAGVTLGSPVEGAANEVERWPTWTVS